MQNGYLNSKMVDWAIFWSVKAKKGQKQVKTGGLVKLAKKICPKTKIQLDNDF